MPDGIIGGANASDPGRPRRPKVTVDAPAPRPAAKEISTQTPSELRRLMKRQQGRARGMLKQPGRKLYSKG